MPSLLQSLKLHLLLVVNGTFKCGFQEQWPMTVNARPVTKLNSNKKRPDVDCTEWFILQTVDYVNVDGQLYHRAGLSCSNLHGIYRYAISE